MEQAIFFGILWIEEGRYEAFRAACDDSEKLPHTHADFAKGFEKTKALVEGQGNIFVKVEVDVEEFLAWCRVNGRRPDAKGRLGFANVKAHDYAIAHMGRRA